MELQKISVLNFKGLREAEFTPTRFGCLVGENNAGKSSVLQAIVVALNRPTQLPTNLFYDSDVPVKFSLTFTGVTPPHFARLAEEHRDRIAAIVVDETLNLTVTYNPNERVEVSVLRRMPRNEQYRAESIDDCFSGKRGRQRGGSL
ncbi:AAA family ATPase [Janthinobacterium lividum]|uniref:AAA family ATPase n=1 Tax=Janthinobacterium lividum TaxID=29581 RepID=UPI0020925F9F|nr:AAA family ATPase [Janthinobacterium lividum]